MMKEILKSNKLTYILSKPDRFDESKVYPTIIFLHGAGTRGNDIELLKQNPYFTLTEPHQLNAVTFAPQCYADSWFDIFEQLQELIRYAIGHSFVNQQKVYLIGASMGGYAVWQMAMSHPEWFAAIIPICGGGMYWNASRLINMGIWAFHGSDDDTVKKEESIKMINAVNQCGGTAKLTIFEGVKHDSWINAYSDINTFRWLFQNELSQPALQSDHLGNPKAFG